MKRGLDWYKREPRAVIDGNRAARMTTRTWAVFDLLLDLIYEGGGQTPDDPSYVAGHFQDIGPAVARKEIAHLIGLGKIDREGAFLTNKRAKNQAKTRQNLSETRAKVGQKGGISSGVSRSQSNENNDITEANASSKTQAEKRERREESGGDACAREALLDEIASMAKADLRRMDWLDFNLRPAVERWLALGLDEAEVRETVRTVMASRRDPGPVSSPRYFDNAMQRAAGEKQRPALQPINGGRSAAVAESAHPHVDIDAILAKREQKRREQGNG